MQKLCDQDYALLPEKAYKLLKEWYGGPGPDFPRRVVEVGQQREAKVEVFPYFLSYSTAESPSLAGTPRATAGEAPLMLDSTTPVESAVKQLCEAAGVEERYAQLYLVSEGGAMGHVEAKLAPPNGGGAAPAAAAGSERKLEPVDPKSYEQRTLADVFFGQHRVQVRARTHPHPLTFVAAAAGGADGGQGCRLIIALCIWCCRRGSCSSRTASGGSS